MEKKIQKLQAECTSCWKYTSTVTIIYLVTLIFSPILASTLICKENCILKTTLMKKKKEEK